MHCGSMEPSLLVLAEAQGGVFTTAQARTLGVSARAMKAMRRRREISFVARSVSMVGADRPREDEARLLLNTRAALALYPDARAVGASSLVASGLPIYGVQGSRADVVRPVHREVLTALCRIRPPHDDLRPMPGPAPGTSGELAAAIVQTALDHGHLPAVVAADRALNAGSTTVEEIMRVSESVQGWPDSGRVRTLLAFMDGRSQSVGETRLRLFVRSLGWAVTPQLPIEDDGGVFAFADLGVDGSNLLLEFDGQVKYASDPKALWKEKRREDRGRRAGYLFERVIWAELGRPRVLCARLTDARARAGDPPRP
jgi:hypothetical protein